MLYPSNWSVPLKDMQYMSSSTASVGLGLQSIANLDTT